MYTVRTLAFGVAAFSFLTLGTIFGTGTLSAQITDQILAHVNHGFVVGNKTLPPGDYTFRIERNSDLGVMIVQNKNGDNVAQFAVRQSIDNHTPAHSQLVFKRYGNTEFLSKVYESGSRSGVAVDAISSEEQRLMKSGQQGTEHIEEQQ